VIGIIIISSIIIIIIVIVIIIIIGGDIARGINGIIDFNGEKLGRARLVAIMAGEAVHMIDSI